MSRLEQNLEAVQTLDLSPNNIAVAAREQVAKLTKDGVSISGTQNAFNGIARFMAPTEKLAMGLSRIDPHHIAPIVLGGIFSVIQIMTNNTEGHITVVKIIEDLLPIMTTWSFVDEKQIRTNRRKNFVPFYEDLRNAIVGMFRKIMILLGKILTFLSNNFSKRKRGIFFTLFSSSCNPSTRCTPIFSDVSFGLFCVFSVRPNRDTFQLSVYTNVGYNFAKRLFFLQYNDRCALNALNSDEQVLAHAQSCSSRACSLMGRLNQENLPSSFRVLFPTHPSAP